MKVAVVNHHGGIAGGSERSLMDYLESLPADIEPIFFFFEDGEFARRMRERYPRSLIVPMSPRMAKSTRSSVGIAALLDAGGLTLRLARALRAAGVDVVLTNSVKAHFLGAIAAKLAGVPCLTYVHDLLEGKSLRALRLVSRYFVHGRLACSQSVARTLALPNIEVMYAPVRIPDRESLPLAQEARKRLGLPDDDLPVIGLVGRIAPWKGQARFIRIAGRALERVDAHFVIVGSAVFGCDPAYPVYLRQQVAELGLGRRIHFVEWQESMSDVYAAIDVGCNCSDEEPFGRTTLEAQLHQIPVVCFADAGVCELFEDGAGGRKIPVGDEAAYARAIVEFVQDPGRRQASGVAARHAAEKLSIETQAPKFAAALYRGARRTPPEGRRVYSHSA